MKTVVMIVRDEEFYIDMCLESILPYVDGLYILDTGSKDRTIDIIFEYATNYSKIICETKDFGGNTRFGVGYRERDARNFALDRAKTIYNPEWIICMDADEVYTENFWNILDNVPIEVGSIGHSTDFPTTLTSMSRHPNIMHDWHGHKLHDPHVRVWNTNKYDVQWIHPDNRHVVLSHNSMNDLVCDYVIKDTVHFHFHHTLGPKSIHSYLNKGILTQPGDSNGILSEDIYNQEYYKNKYPELFNDKKQFVPPIKILKSNLEVSISIPEESKLPNLVTQTWNNWWNIDYLLA